MSDTPTRPKVKKNYGRIPERVWKDPAFRDDVTDDGKLLFLTLQSLPTGDNPRAAGIWRISPALLCEYLGANWPLERFHAARESLCKSKLAQYDDRAHIWYVPDSYWPAENHGWWVGRLRRLANMPQCEFRDRAIAIELSRSWADSERAFLMSLERECQIDLDEIRHSHGSAA